MKFLFISPTYSGGTGGHVSMLANHLQNSGHEVKKMKIPHIPIKNLKNPSFAIFSILKVILDKEKYDIVHAFNIPSAFALRYAHGRKKVLTVHGVYSDQVNMIHSSQISSIATNIESKVLKWADKLTTDSQISKMRYKEKLNLDFEYLPTPIDPKIFKNIPNVEKSQNQIVYIGRDSFEKGIDILRKIESEVNGNVIYCTNKPWKETMKILKSSSILVVPSRIESLPTVIKEAQYLKTPVIAFSVGGIPELIKNNETGLLIDEDNSKMFLDTINKLLSDETLQHKLSSKAFDDVQKKFTWKIVLPKYLQFYEKLLYEK